MAEYLLRRDTPRFVRHNRTYTLSAASARPRSSGQRINMQADVVLRPRQHEKPLNAGMSGTRLRIPLGGRGFRFMAGVSFCCVAEAISGGAAFSRPDASRGLCPCHRWH